MKRPPVGPANVARPAMVRKVPTAVQIHWTALYPDVANMIDPETGMPKPQRERTGGQFSCRRLCVINIFYVPPPGKPPECRYIVVMNHVSPDAWPLQKFERLSDPEAVNPATGQRLYPGDTEPGNVEVIFDFQEDYQLFMEANKVRVRVDPLAKNDFGGGLSAMEIMKRATDPNFQQSLQASMPQIAPPPGSPG